MEQISLRKDLTKLLGENQVIFEQSILERYGASFTGALVLPVCIVYPTKQIEIKAIIKIASHYQVAIHTISRGKNFGYGSAQGTAEGQIIIDLSQLNSIIEVNQELCYCVIEPGVSQDQMYQHLQKLKGKKLQLDVTGAGLEASIVGNVLERGFGHTDYGDRYARIINMKVVLANGAEINTGFGSYGEANAFNTFRYGIGPQLDGLFTQSNFGIVTQMTLELMPKPEKSLMFVLSTKEENDIGHIVDAIRELKLSGVVNSAVHIANRARAVGQKKNHAMIGAWNLSGSISGQSEIVSVKKKIIRKVFAKHLKKYTLMFIGLRLIDKLGWINKNLRAIPLYGTLQDAWDLQTGKPSDHPLKILFDNREIESKSFSPSTFDKNFRWICAVSRADASSVVAMLGLLEKLFTQHKYEYRVTLTAITPRSMILIGNVVFDRDEKSVREAKEFYNTCTNALLKAGYFPYRSGSGGFGSIPKANDDLNNFLKVLKTAVDPQHILSPGKYNI